MLNHRWPHRVVGGSQLGHSPVSMHVSWYRTSILAVIPCYFSSLQRASHRVFARKFRAADTRDPEPHDPRAASPIPDAPPNSPYSPLFTQTSPIPAYPKLLRSSGSYTSHSSEAHVALLLLKFSLPPLTFVPGFKSPVPLSHLP